MPDRYKAVKKPKKLPPRTTSDILDDIFGDVIHKFDDDKCDLEVMEHRICRARHLFMVLKNRNISVEEFSRMSKISRGVMGEILTCRATLSAANAEKIRHFLRVLGFGYGPFRDHSLAAGEAMS